MFWSFRLRVVDKKFDGSRVSLSRFLNIVNRKEEIRRQQYQDVLDTFKLRRPVVLCIFYDAQNLEISYAK